MLPRNATHLNLSLVSPSGVTAAPPTPRSSASYSAFNKNFVDTLEDRGNVSDYPLKRTRSASSFENEGPRLTIVTAKPPNDFFSLTCLNWTEQMYTYYKQLEAKIGILQRELLGLRQKVETVEEDMGKTQWGVKYSRTCSNTPNITRFPLFRYSFYCDSSFWLKDTSNLTRFSFQDVEPSWLICCWVSGYSGAVSSNDYNVVRQVFFRTLLACLNHRGWTTPLISSSTRPGCFHLVSPGYFSLLLSYWLQVKPGNVISGSQSRLAQAFGSPSARSFFHGRTTSTYSPTCCIFQLNGRVPARILERRRSRFELFFFGLCFVSHISDSDDFIFRIISDHVPMARICHLEVTQTSQPPIRTTTNSFAWLYLRLLTQLQLHARELTDTVVLHLTSLARF